jgi:hypothetical protein
MNNAATTTNGSAKSVQGSRVQLELEALRSKGLASNRRNEFKDCE